MAEIKVTQQMINEYRAVTGNYVLTDSAIAEKIKNEPLPEGFNLLAFEAQKAGYHADSSNLFGYGFDTNTDIGLTFEKTTVPDNKAETKAEQALTLGDFVEDLDKKSVSEAKREKIYIKPFSEENFIEEVGLDINNPDREKILDRINSISSYFEIYEISVDGKDIKQVLESNDLEPTFDNISNVMEILYGVTLRNEEELKATGEQRNKIIMQIQAANIMEHFFSLSAQWCDQYTDNLGLYGLGSEGIGYVINKLGLGGKNDFQWADSSREYAARAGKLSVLNPEKFKVEFKKIYRDDGKYGIEFNEEKFNNLLELVRQEKIFDGEGELTKEGKDAILQAFNFAIYNPNASTYNQVMNGFGEALMMIATLGWGATTKGGQMIATTSMAAFSRAGVAIASKGINHKLLQGALRFTGKGVKLLGPAINEGTKLAMYTATTGTLANATNRIVKFDSEENSWEKFLETEAMVMEGAKGSFAFGAFAGIYGSTVTQAVVQRVSKVSSKVTTALADKFAIGAVDASEVYATAIAKSVPTGALEKVMVEAAAFATDVVGFTAFETAIVLFDQVKNLPENEQPQKFTELLWEEFKGQGYNLGQIKIVSHLVMWLSGSRGARMASTEYLKKNLPQLEGVTVRKFGEGYKIKLKSGRTIECKDGTEMISSLELMVRGETVFSKKIQIQMEIQSLVQNLENVLKSEYCDMPDIMSLIPKNASPEQKLTYLKELYEQSKYFSRISNNEKAYGKNFKFALLMSEISVKARELISKGESFNTVLAEIAQEYSRENEINSTMEDRLGASGIYRWHENYEPQIDPIFGRIDGYMTGFGSWGTKYGTYEEYTSRLRESSKVERKNNIEGFTLTRIMKGKDIMQHPYPEEAHKNMLIIEKKYQEFQVLVEEYNTKGLLSQAEQRLADNIIAEIYFLMANTCPFKRGSNGISDVLMRSCYSAIGQEMPHIKKGVGLDLEAFCMDLETYKSNWRSFFEESNNLSSNPATILGESRPSQNSNSITQEAIVKPTAVEKDRFQETISKRDANEIMTQAELPEYCKFDILDSCTINGEINKALFERLVKIAKNNPEISSWMVEHLKNENKIDEKMLLKFDEIYNLIEIKELSEIHSIFELCSKEGKFNEEVYQTVLRIASTNKKFTCGEICEFLNIAVVENKFLPKLCSKIENIIKAEISIDYIYKLNISLHKKLGIDIKSFLEMIPDEIIIRELKAGRLIELTEYIHYPKERLSNIASLLRQTSISDDMSIGSDRFADGNIILKKQYLQEGYSKNLAQIFSNITVKDFNKTEVENLYNIFVEKFLKTNNNELRHSELSALGRMIDKILLSKNADIKSLQEYILNIDIEKIAEIEPSIKDYSIENLLFFIEYHYLSGNTTFTSETLTFPQNLTEYLCENYLTEENMQKLLSAHPRTDRNIGKFPEKWFSEISGNKELITSELRIAIESFVKGSIDIEALSNRLSSLLSKPVEIRQLGEGCFGTGYLIDMPGVEKVVLKKFHHQDSSTHWHGAGAEVQAGLFVNEHSNDFVKMYCGKIIGKGHTDGYLITQYIAEDIIPIENSNIKSGYHIVSFDSNAITGHNIIGNKVIDFGAIGVIKLE